MSGDNLGQLEYECRVGKVDAKGQLQGVRAKRSRRRGRRRACFHLCGIVDM